MALILLDQKDSKAMRKKSHLSNPPKRRRPKSSVNGFSSHPDSHDSASRDSSLYQDDEDIDVDDTPEPRIPDELKCTDYDAFNHYLFNDYPLQVEATVEKLTLDDSLPLTDQLKRAIRPPSFDSYDSMHWQPGDVYNIAGMYPEVCVEEEDFTRIKKQLDMEHIGKCSSWDEGKSSSWYSSNHDSFSEDSCGQTKAFTADGKLQPVQVLATGEVVAPDNSVYKTGSGQSKHSGRRKEGKSQRFESYKDLIENKPKKIEPSKEVENPRYITSSKPPVVGHECEKCGTLLKTAIKMQEHLERHKQLESLKKLAGQLPNKEQLVKEVPVLVNRALKGIMDEEAVSNLEKRVEAYARRLYYNSFPLWKEISRELVHEVWQYVTLTELALLPTVDGDHFIWSRNMWLTTGGRRESFVLNLLFLYPDDSEVVEVFFYKFFVKLNEAVYKFGMKCLGSPDVTSDSLSEEHDARSDPGLEDLHTLCALVLRTYVKRASQNKTVKGWSAVYKCMKRNFLEHKDSGKHPKSAEMKDWAFGESNSLVASKQAFKLFSLLEAVIDNINKVNPTCDGPAALHKLVLRAVYLRQDIIRAWDKLVATSHFEEMDSLFVLEMLVKSFAFFSGCANARKQKEREME
ncbi:uncharacterized protein LOC117649822 isoform X2 [Thrips palmi]|uniref:Uncharacterized protein LOC117649822 isoform X2 n=1 Tax=Thrips palmi TaxID=161013 RepID=A0A6P8ZV49_THRPL|nr:uncharacterized protein LOC117649822 isoform X2 [Thrips palmi]XP_034248812.1 uncharacterized protein LOC117649822 isoform X2 [Thrips palmi]XP_034248813.1 uncharacterized protein LOC117649822 isoform X2 [Thrips palmi]